ncbi:MAG TPA: zinc ribbon domain-containing protein [Desulfobulbaceae bacterium]|nr:zinc ribbon domain-containing protein [Desulfobulbaceae bacterium]
MPIYEYVCSECKSHFEALVSVSSPEIIRCPKCDSLKVKKTMSAASFRLGHGGSSIPAGAMAGCSSKSGFS